MHVFIEIPSGSQPISHLLSGENFRKFSGNFLPMLNFRKIYNPRYGVYTVHYIARWRSIQTTGQTLDSQHEQSDNTSSK